MKTLPISDDAHVVIRRWCIKLGIKMVQFGDRLVEEVEHKNQQEFYLALGMPNRFHKPLSGVKIRSNYKNKGFA